MPAKPEVVAYLAENLKKFPADQLKEQLLREGVSAAEFEEALQAAKKAASKPRPAPRTAAKVLCAGALAAGVAAALVSLSRKPEQPAPAPAATPILSPQESGYVGHYGYVVRLPKSYVAVQNFKDQRKTVELVHFCKAGTDPTQFLDERLYGQLGIVRLQAAPSEFPDDLNGLAALTNTVSSRASARGEKFTMKNIQISSMRGIQVNYDLPNARIEAYILGDKVLYEFMAGQDDATYQDILNSLRDANSET